MTKLQVIERIRKDCDEKGHGRKKWWAENLGIHQQTLSYWLHGKRTPSAKHIERIHDVCSIMGDKGMVKFWHDHLLHFYFNNVPINHRIFALIIKEILVAETVDSRTLGFLSRSIAESQISDLNDEHSLLRNRLGWILEVSNKSSYFEPTKSKTMLLISIGGSYNKPAAIKYLKKVQTKLGRRWHLYDCDISQIKKSYVTGLKISQ